MSEQTNTAQVIALARWLLIGLVIVLAWFALSYLASVLAPILAALLIAYLLNPIVARLARHGFSRSAGAALILVAFIGLLATAFAFVVPRVADQIVEFGRDMPHMYDNVAAWMKDKFNVTIPSDWRSYLDKIDASTMSGGRELATAALGGVFSVLGAAAEFLLVPVFSFYFLSDFPNLIRRIDHMIPPRRRATVREVVREIDTVVAGWLRGQAIVTSILMVLYATLFTVVGMPLSLPIGLLVGLLTVIPFVGTFVGASIAMVVTLADGGGSSTMLSVAGVILCLHVLEAGILTPKIVGHRVGLSESGALFAVVAGGKLLGFVGVVLAVPIAATCAVVARLAVKYYEHTTFFGHESDADVVITPAMALIMPGVVPGAKIIAAEPTEPELNPELEPSDQVASTDPYDWAIEPELGAAGIHRGAPEPPEPLPVVTLSTPEPESEPGKSEP
nr:AI-2E family transporter [Kofleriaceae bacterium]